MSEQLQEQFEIVRAGVENPKNPEQIVLLDLTGKGLRLIAAVIGPGRYTRIARCSQHGQNHLIAHGSEEHHDFTACDLCFALGYPHREPQP